MGAALGGEVGENEGSWVGAKVGCIEGICVGVLVCGH